MSTEGATITSITLAAHDAAAAADFYNAVFDAGLSAFAAYGATLYRGHLGGVRLVICPNTIAGVRAEQNRHQITIQVPNLAAALEAAYASGGSVDEGDDPQQVVVRDPDGNTIVLVEA
jgi:catechol 2,3-dioxygenase-like lactoylglutathione lyase family enzyme